MDDGDGDLQERRRFARVENALDTIESRLDHVADRVRMAAELVRHQLTITGTRRPDGSRAIWGHCGCGDWDIRSSNVDLVADEYHRHAEAVVQPSLFAAS